MTQRHVLRHVSHQLSSPGTGDAAIPSIPYCMLRTRSPLRFPFPRSTTIVQAKAHGHRSRDALWYPRFVAHLGFYGPHSPSVSVRQPRRRGVIP